MPQAVLTEPPGFCDIDNVYSGDEMGRPFRSLVGEGVVGASELVVTERAAGATMGIDVAPGHAWVEGDTSPLIQPTYHQVVEQVIEVSVDAADGSNPRVDRVVLRVDDALFDASGERRGRIEVITGTPASSPSAPAEPDTAITLAFITVPAADTTVEDAQITDMRQPACPDKRQVGSYGFGGWASAPWGALLLDGSSFDGDRYPRLAAALGGTSLPDLRGRALVGAGQGAGLTNRALGAEIGAESHTLTAAQSGMPSHSHQIDDPGHNHGSTNQAGSHSHSMSSEGAHTHQLPDNAAFGGGSPALTNQLIGLDFRTGEQTGTAGAHTHTINSGGAHSHSTQSSFTGIAATLNASSQGASQGHNNMQPSLAATPVVWV